MHSGRREVELNAARRRQEAREAREHLVTASNELFLHELKCRETGRTIPESLRRAHAAIRAELRRLEREEERDARRHDLPGAA
jgi:glutamyl-tRNA reductase